jgi:maltokinase
VLLTGADTGAMSFTHDAGSLGEVPGRLVGVEQSNTSVVYGDDAILKVFRRLAPGPNPDLEVTQALTRAGSTHVPPVLGHATGPVAEESTTLAVLQQFLPHATDGWRLATTSVRDLFAEGDLHADEVGGDFASEAERLGRVTAEVHATLAGALESADEQNDGTRATVARANARLDAALADVPELATFEPELRTAYAEWAAWLEPVAVQRIHGDLHLGQVLRSETGWHLIDFEGEPARPLSERRELMTPLRDVAGMLRSFDYASRSLLADRPPDHSLEYRATEWADRNRNAFCDGYAEAAGYDPRSAAPVLRGCELDKAVYEAVYEARHRPSWLPIPLAGMRRLLSPAEPGR